MRSRFLCHPLRLVLACAIAALASNACDDEKNNSDAAAEGDESHDEHERSDDEGLSTIFGNFEEEPIVGQNTLIVRVEDESGNGVEGAQVTVSPEMESHGHGSTEQPEVTELGGGEYRAFPVTLQMPGEWTIHLLASKGEETWHNHVEVTVD